MFSNMKSVKRTAVLAFAVFTIAALAVSAAAPTMTVTTQRVPGTGIAAGQNVYDVATLHGSDSDGQNPTGTVQFYICHKANAVGADWPTCTSPANGVAFGGAVVLVGCGTDQGCTATSATITVNSNGTYCFLAVFTSSGFYPNATDTTSNTTSECFTISGATAVTVSSMSARLIEDGASWAMWGLGALGMVTLGAVVFVVARRRQS